MLVAAILGVALLGTGWGAYRVARAHSAPPRFAAAMPHGALVYLEARDLGTLLGAWLGSPTRERYFRSASYRSFKRSRLYLKIQDRLSDLQKGFGVDITDERLAELAAGPAAIAIYDPGKLDVLVAAEVPRDRALASSLFAQAKNFEERHTAGGSAYYAREVSTEAGGAVVRIAFGYAGDRLWVGTNETTVAEAIDGPKDGGLQPAVAETIGAAGDFAAHDVLMWLDLERSVRNKYFNLYWIQKNAADLADLESGLIDLEFAADGVHERRWFVSKHALPAPPTGDGSATLSRLRRLAPPGTQLVEVKYADSDLSPAVAQTLFGPERRSGTPELVSASRSDDPFGQSGSDDASDDTPSANKYRYLDSRFDSDVDDPAAATPPAADVAPEGAKTTVGFGDRVAAIVGAANPICYASYSAVELPDGQLFAGFDRTIVVELGNPERFAAAEFEGLVRDEFGRRFVVGADTSRVSWTDVSGARGLAGALVEQGGAYRIVGKFLVIGRRGGDCSVVAERLAGQLSGDELVAPSGALSRVAEVRVDLAREPFSRLMSVLDARQRASIDEDVDSSGNADDDDSNGRPVAFFSENIASLLDVAKDLASVRIATTVQGSVMRERVDYVWKVAAATAAPAHTKAGA